MHFNYANPYTSTRLPVFARNVVSTSHPVAAQAGLRMLLNIRHAREHLILVPTILAKQHQAQHTGRQPHRQGVSPPASTTHGLVNSFVLDAK